MDTSLLWTVDLVQRRPKCILTLPVQYWHLLSIALSSVPLVSIIKEVRLYSQLSKWTPVRWMSISISWTGSVCPKLADFHMFVCEYLSLRQSPFSVGQLELIPGVFVWERANFKVRSLSDELSQTSWFSYVCLWVSLIKTVTFLSWTTRADPRGVRLRESELQLY